MINDTAAGGHTATPIPHPDHPAMSEQVRGGVADDLVELRNFFGGNGCWNCTVTEVEPTGWDGSGKWWRHYVGQGPTAEAALSAAFASAHSLRSAAEAARAQVQA